MFAFILAGLTAFSLPGASVTSTTDPPDLRPLCIVAVGSSDQTLVDSCIVRLEALRITLPGVTVTR